MIFIYFKFIVANVFMINMQFSKINCSKNAAVALQKIVFNEKRDRFVPESEDAYFTRNIKKRDEETGLLSLYNVLHQRYKFEGEIMDEDVYYINKDFQIIMSSDQIKANDDVPQKYLTMLNMMKQKEANLANPETPIFYYNLLYENKRQVQFYRYLLYPYENENIYDYWNRVDTKLKSCLQNNNEFDFIDTKVQHIDNIRYGKINVPRSDNLTDREYADLLLQHHQWFYTLVSSKPLIGEDMTNYHLRNVRLGFAPMALRNLEIFYNDFTQYINITVNSFGMKNSKISEIKNNFYIPEFFILHIIYHCKLPPSEFIEYTEKKVPKKNKKERAESSKSKRFREDKQINKS